MSEDDSRRLTDREVAMVLRSASEIDARRGSEGGRGLSVEELREIAREVGISHEALSMAVERLGQTDKRVSLLRGAPAAHRAVHAVPGELNDQALGQIIRLIDEWSDSAGSVSEALGSVRWTGGDRFHSRQVSLTPEAGETRIQVVDKVPPRIRRVMHALPMAWGTMLAGAMAASADMTAAATVLVIGGGLTVGGGLGRLVWNHLSARRGRRVEALAARLSDQARTASERGLVVPDRATRS